MVNNNSNKRSSPGSSEQSLNNAAAANAEPDAKRQKVAPTFDLSEFEPSSFAKAFLATDLSDVDYEVLKSVIEASLILEELRSNTGKIATVIFNCSERGVCVPMDDLLKGGSERLEEAKKALKEASLNKDVEDPVEILRTYRDKVVVIAKGVNEHLGIAMPDAEEVKEQPGESTGESTGKSISEEARLLDLQTLRTHLINFQKSCAGKDTFSERTREAVQEFKEMIGSLEMAKEDEKDDAHKQAAYALEMILIENYAAVKHLIEGYKQLQKVYDVETSVQPKMMLSAPESAPDSKQATVDKNVIQQQIYFVTNRKFDETKKIYTTEITKTEMDYGFGEVNIPKPGVANKKKEYHPTVESETRLPVEKFTAELNAKLAESPNKEIFFFIHGFNVDHNEAMGAAATLCEDVDFKGVMVALDWASYGSLLAYDGLPGNDDGNRVQDSKKPFAQALSSLLNNLLNVKGVHILCHSMGNLLFCRMMSQDDYLTGPPGGKVPFSKLKTITFAAPDCNREEFSEMLDIMTKIPNIKPAYTIYCSEVDKALWASNALRLFREPRVGSYFRGFEGRRDHFWHPYFYLASDDVKTVDVNENSLSTVGHSYYTDDREVVDDIRHVITQSNASDRKKEGRCKNENCPKYLLQIPKEKKATV